ncbi:MAG: hypothetical protein ABI921_15870 [Panacibacter sp.]
MFAKSAVVISLLFCFSFVSKAQTAEAVIANYISFTGGANQWKKISSITSSGTYNYGGMEFPFEAYQKTPDLYMYKVSSNGKYFAQAFDGNVGWKIDGFKDETTKTILNGKEARAMANEANVDLESELIDYKEKGYVAMLEGKDSFGNILCYKVKLTGNSNDTATYFFSTNDFSLLKKQAVSKNAELDNSLLDTYYTDYTTIKGMKFPFKMISKVGDQTMLTITVKKLQLNIAIPDSIFKP